MGCGWILSLLRQSEATALKEKHKEYRRVGSQQDLTVRRYWVGARVWAMQHCSAKGLGGERGWGVSGRLGSQRRVLLALLVGGMVWSTWVWVLHPKMFQGPLQCQRPAADSPEDQDGDKSSPEPDLEGRFTVLVNTFKRPTNLQESIRHYSACPGVDAIRVVWSEQDMEPPSPDREEDAMFFTPPGSGCAPVSFDRHPTASINNRFRPLAGLRTTAVFSVDDDVNVQCDDLLRGHKAWRQNEDALVGFIPRVHLLNRKLEGALLYRRWWTVWLTGKYSIILTKACFMHERFLEAYTHHAPHEIIDFVDRKRNCEDIAMQFVVGNATGAPPVWVLGRYSDSGGLDGISTTGVLHHRNVRDDCLTFFSKVYNGMTLKTTSNVLVSATSWNTFFNPPTWIEWLAFP